MVVCVYEYITLVHPYLQDVSISVLKLSIKATNCFTCTYVLYYNTIHQRGRKIILEIASSPIQVCKRRTRNN